MKPMEEEFFTSKDAAKITGCTPRQLQYWRQKKLVVPTVNTTGTGRNVYYSVSDLLQLKVMRQLLSVGLSFEVCKDTLDSLRKLEPQFFKETFSYKAKKRFMLWQQSPQHMVELSEFNEEKAIAAIRDGRAVIPFWTETVGHQLNEEMELFKQKLLQLEEEIEQIEYEGSFSSDDLSRLGEGSTILDAVLDSTSGGKIPRK
jgi:DNA-binding transcriptional MerR regulator